MFRTLNPLFRSNENRVFRFAANKGEHRKSNVQHGLQSPDRYASYWELITSVQHNGTRSPLAPLGLTTLAGRGLPALPSLNGPKARLARISRIFRLLHHEANNRSQIFRKRTGQPWPPNASGPWLTLCLYSGSIRWPVSPWISSLSWINTPF